MVQQNNNQWTEIKVHAVIYLLPLREVHTNLAQTV